MLKFFACYIWLGFGFLLAFKILFPHDRTFAGFPTPLITMLLMMLGDINIGMIFPTQTRIILEKHQQLKEDAVSDKDDSDSYYGGNSDDEKNYLQFSGDSKYPCFKFLFNMVILHITGTAHFFFAAYVAIFSIVIMNLLIGLAVADIDALMKKARRENIISQIELIYDMMEIRVTPIYRYCAPECLKTLYER